MDRNLSRSRNSGGRDHDDYERNDRTVNFYSHTY